MSGRERDTHVVELLAEAREWINQCEFAGQFEDAHRVMMSLVQEFESVLIQLENAGYE